MYLDKKKVINIINNDGGIIAEHINVEPQFKEGDNVKIGQAGDTPVYAVINKIQYHPIIDDYLIVYKILATIDVVS